LREQRRALHFRAAESLAERSLPLHAEHLDLAEAPEAAAAYLAAATDQAQRVRPEAALQLAERGMEICSDEESYPLGMLSGHLLLRLGQISKSIEAYRTAISNASEGIERCRALMGLAEGLRITESYSELMDSLDLALQELGDTDLPSERARICQLKGSVHFVHWDYQSCLRENTLSLEFARQAESQELQAQALGNLGDFEFAAGRMTSAHDRFDQCIALSREHGLDNVIAANQSMRGQTLLYLCQPDKALIDCEASLALAVRLFNPRAELVARLVGLYVLELSDADAVRIWAEAGLTIAKRLGAHRFEQVCVEYLGRIAAIEGDRETAERLVGDAVLNFRKSESSMRFLGGRALGSLALVSQDPERRRGLLAEGEDLLQRMSRAHNPLWFYRDAIEVSLDLGDWREAERFATCLEDYTCDQPLPWSRFFASRGRALAKAGRGENATEALKALHAEARQIGFAHTLERIERAL
jgi:tetratricopeptide (TPR) repeat protein